MGALGTVREPRSPEGEQGFFWKPQSSGRSCQVISLFTAQLSDPPALAGSSPRRKGRQLCMSRQFPFRDATASHLWLGSWSFLHGCPHGGYALRSLRSCGPNPGMASLSFSQNLAPLAILSYLPSGPAPPLDVVSWRLCSLSATQTPVWVQGCACRSHCMCMFSTEFYP